MEIILSFSRLTLNKKTELDSKSL